LDFLSLPEAWKAAAAIITAIVGAIGSYMMGKKGNKDSQNERTHASLNTALDRQAARITALEKQLQARDEIIRQLQKQIIELQIDR
jgi:septal ring factor EnvC (AmiA/AmiB activator)